MDTTIVSAKNYDEALTKALIELGTASDNVDIKVLEKGSGGFLGIFGGKPWKLEVSVKKPAAKDIIKSDNALKNQTSARAAEKRKEINPAEKKYTVHSPVKYAENREDVKTERHEDKDIYVRNALKKSDEYSEYYGEEESHISRRHVFTNDELEKVRDVSDKFLKELFDAMGMSAKAVYNFSFKTNEFSIVLESEEDMGVLIGKRGQTLDSLQYILSLVINRSSESFVRIKLDTENYRSRRKEKLEILARNIASKVKKTGKFTELEPMNAYERRIIHAALQGDNMVSTKSVGEEPFRHIMIYPKKNNYRAYKKSPRREMNIENKSENTD